MGYGDEIMATADCREAKLASPGSQIVIGDTTPAPWTPQADLIFKNNPHITAPDRVNESKPVVYVKNFPRNRPYIDHIQAAEQQGLSFPGALNVSKIYLSTSFKAKRGDIFFSKEELEQIKALKDEYHDAILLHPMVKSAIQHNKDWGIKKWSSLRDELLARDKKLVQSRGNLKPEELPLTGVPSVQTKTFRGMCTLLAAVGSVVVAEGGIHHAAAALDKKTVVIYGGRVSPKTLGYDFQDNMYIEDDPESPCGMKSPCAHCKACMEQISVEQVLSKIDTI